MYNFITINYIYTVLLYNIYTYHVVLNVTWSTTNFKFSVTRSILHIVFTFLILDTMTLLAVCASSGWEVRFGNIPQLVEHSEDYLPFWLY